MQKGMKEWNAKYTVGSGKDRPLDRYDVTVGPGRVTLTTYGPGDWPILNLEMGVASAEMLHAYLGEVLAELKAERPADYPITPEEHKRIHDRLHRAMDELVADWMAHEKKPLLNRPIIELMKWSHAQTQNPTTPV